MNFHVPILVPSINKYINFRELLNKQYKVILKYSQNNDDINLERYFNYIIDELNDDIKHVDINKIDKLCILLMIRAISIGSEIKLQLKCETTEKPYVGSIDLNNILEHICNFNILKSREVKVMDNITITLGTPNRIYNPIDDILEMVSDTITDIYISGKRWELSSMNILEKREVINSLPGFAFNEVIQYAERYQKKLADLVIFTDKSPHDPDSTEHEYRLRLHDNSMFEFLKTCYADNLRSYYDTIYTLCDSMNFSAEYIENITPIESSIFIKYKQAELARKEEAKKSSNSGPSIGSMASPMDI